MTYEEFKRHLGKAGLSIKDFAGLLKQNPNSFTNYKTKGEVPDHIAVIVALMGVMADNALDFREVVSALDLEPNKPRGAAKSATFGSDKDK